MLLLTCAQKPTRVSLIYRTEREFIYQVHNKDNTRQLLQWQAASGGISPSQLAAHNKKKHNTHILTEKSAETKNVKKLN